MEQKQLDQLIADSAELQALKGGNIANINTEALEELKLTNPDEWYAKKRQLEVDAQASSDKIKMETTKKLKVDTLLAESKTTLEHLQSVMPYAEFIAFQDGTSTDISKYVVKPDADKPSQTPENEETPTPSQTQTNGQVPSLNGTKGAGQGEEHTESKINKSMTF